MNQQRSTKKRKLKRLHVGGLPLIHAIATRMKLRDILYKYIPGHGNEDIPAVETLMLLVYNLVLGKDPLYELEEWVQSIDFRCLNLEKYAHIEFNDDRFGRTLNKLYRVDRASLMTELVVFFVNEFNIVLDRVSNDSTTVKAFGKYPGKTRSGLELRRGHSKDHRPDLKQLVFCLSITGDGAVPIHYKCYPGNVTDDKTHIETWNTLRKITGTPDFLYVADSKLCTDDQLSYIVDKGGRAVTIIPLCVAPHNGIYAELIVMRSSLITSPANMSFECILTPHKIPALQRGDQFVGGLETSRAHSRSYNRF